MKRTIDIFFSSIFVVFAILPSLIIVIAIKLNSKGPAVYWSDRVGLNNKIFKMPKFRSMRIDTPTTATHLLEEPNNYLTPVGNFLRKTSLDELPQIWCVLRGRMSLVGPRPALYNQNDLISLRTSKNVHTILPGITGLAQINGRDELSIEKKVKLDEEYLIRRTTMLDINILFRTAFKVINKNGVSH